MCPVTNAEMYTQVHKTQKYKLFSVVTKTDQTIS